LVCYYGISLEIVANPQAPIYYPESIKSGK